ncbi:MAG: hypothetical protein HND56_05770 [Pseudomonadota bacterium]|nr:hypothetical protein [Pseudomonadota bacterium]QKK05224.1 MAG: hypothetical protein HND56_05770 [Pseudomonadota bacterium]
MADLGKSFQHERNSLKVYGSPGNQYGDTMVGGEDVKKINQMLQDAFAAGQAGGGEALVQIGTHKGRNIFEQKAADQIRISLDDDGNAYVKLIIRQLDPGLGLLALAGGFKDQGETDQQAADREEMEEASGATGTLVSSYQIDRRPVAGDVRVWGGPDRADGVKNGDVIAMSTTAMVPVVRNAHLCDVQAGDDATNAGWVKLSDLTDANVFGIKGHAEMLEQAAGLAGLAEQLPQSFSSSLQARNKDILVGTSEERQAADRLIQSSHQPPSHKQTAQKPRLKK